ncbi:MAG: carbamoyltransferase HypF [Candidatus Zixiibacteriota bacterium]
MKPPLVDNRRAGRVTDIDPAATQHLRIRISGHVQGVGFRPFVYRLAQDIGLKGTVRNTSDGVTVDIQGDSVSTDRFCDCLISQLPPHASVSRLDTISLPPAEFDGFTIENSDDQGSAAATVMPDLAACPECVQEIFDSANRRYRYPFTNCTRCGPRYSIIEAVPYDRPRTTMKRFTMCDDCRAEYENPEDRRFHAQPNACPVCGPHLELWDCQGGVIARHDQAFGAACDAIRRGLIVALKGIGGFQLLVDARNDAAVNRLRERKHRPSKPFALMFPDLEHVREFCVVSAIEQDVLLSAASPIVLLHRRPTVDTSHPRLMPILKSARQMPILKRARQMPSSAGSYYTPHISESVAPHNPYLGVMLPYTPLHHLLMHDLGTPIVATSGNPSEEPICTDEHDALRELGAIADLFLIHDRPIARPLDDSVVHVVMNRPSIIRAARGYAPVSVSIDSAAPPCLATGAHLKNTIAFTSGAQIVISQHIGDLSGPKSRVAMQAAIDSSQNLYSIKFHLAACDVHPDYHSTQVAGRTDGDALAVQHHYAHVLSCMTEHGLTPPVLGVSWDGTGLGTDGAIWGGEFLRITESGFERMAHLRTFPLPGGDKAITEPRRSALGVLYEIWGTEVANCGDLAPIQQYPESDLNVILRIIAQDVNTFKTSSAGRLFDALASLLGLAQVNTFEGEAAMQVQFAAERSRYCNPYPFTLVVRDGAAILDWEPMVQAAIDELRNKTSADTIAARCHSTLVEMIVAVVKSSDIRSIVLTGGCFQNRLLLERAAQRLVSLGRQVYWHERVPTNDGGISLGQAAALVNKIRKV